MRTCYIATRLERLEEAKGVEARLEALGLLATYRWWTHGSVKSEGVQRIREVAEAEAEGVAEADVVIVLLPGGRGTHTELGMAIALGKRIYLVGDDGGDDGKTCAFYHHPRVTRIATVNELLQEIGRGA